MSRKKGIKKNKSKKTTLKAINKNHKKSNKSKTKKNLLNKKYFIIPSIIIVIFIVVALIYKSYLKNYEKKSHEKSFVLNTNDSSTIQLINNNENKTAIFKLKIDDKFFFYSNADILTYIKNNYCKNKPLHPKHIWKFISKNRFHDHLIVRNTWQHYPYLFFNSIGGVLCDGASANFFHLCKQANIEARVVDLGGRHVVSEAFIDGKWSLFDTDYSIYFKNENGEILGVNDIAQDTSLLSEVMQIGECPFPSFSLENYSTIFLNKNIVATFYNRLNIPQENVYFSLPPQSTAKFPVINEDNIKTRVAKKIIPNMVLTIPRGIKGKIQYPLITNKISGSGSILIDGEQYDISPEKPLKINSFKKIKILKSQRDINIYFYLNPKIKLKKETELKLNGKYLYDINAKVL